MRKWLKEAWLWLAFGEVQVKVFLALLIFVWALVGLLHRIADFSGK